MATDIGAIVVKLQADISDIKKGMAEATQSVSNFGTSTIVKGNLITAAIEKMGQVVLDVGSKSVRAYAEQQQAITRLNFAVGNDATKSLINYAQELQRTTTYSDDAVISLEAQLSSYGILPGSIKEATLAVVDFAARTGKDLPEAAANFAQAMSGQSRELKRYGLSLDEGATRSQNLAKTTEFLITKFGGTAEVIKGTLLGQFESLKNKIGDIYKRLGEILNPTIEKTIGWMSALADKVMFLIGADEQGLSATQKKIKALQEEQTVLKDTLQAEINHGTVGSYNYELDTKRLIVVTDSIKKLTDQAKAENKVTDSLKTQKGAVDAVINAGQSRINQLIKEAEAEESVQKQITRITELEAAKRVMAAKNTFEANATFSQALAVKIMADTQSWGTVFAGTVMQIRDTFASGMADMIVNGGNFSQAMQDIGKQILQFFIETVIKQMVTQWMIGIGIMKAEMATLYAGAGVPVPPGLAGGAGPGGLGISGGAMAGLGGVVAGVAAGSLIGGHAFGQNSSQGGANVGAGIGAGAGLLLAGPLGAALGGALGGFIGGGVGKSLTKVRKKLFSGGVLGEPSLILGMKSGQVGLAGEDGPEALVSFKDDLGITPAQGRARLTGASRGGGSVGGGSGVTVNISGQFLEATPGKWQRMFRTALLPEIRRYTAVSPTSPFIRRRGQT